MPFYFFFLTLMLSFGVQISPLKWYPSNEKGGQDFTTTMDASENLNIIGKPKKRLAHCLVGSR